MSGRRFGAQHESGGRRRGTRDGIEVVAHGDSIDDEDHYYLIRAFPSASRRHEQLDAFYGSDEWRQSYRDSVLALIDTYHVVVVELTAATREGFRSVLS